MTKSKPASNASNLIASAADLRLADSVEVAAPRYWFWWGLRPNPANLEASTAGGLSWVRWSQYVFPGSGPNRRPPMRYAGAYGRLTVDQLARVADRVKRTIIRPAKAEGDTSRTVGIPILLPTPEEAEAAKKRGRPVRLDARRRETDIPFSALAFLQYVGVEPRCVVGAELPPPLIETGIKLPEDAAPAPADSRVSFPTEE